MYKSNRIYQQIGNNISKLRKSRQLKQEAFASELRSVLKEKYNISVEYTAKTISKWEMGQSIPKMDVLIAICKEYNLSLDELLKDEIKEILSKSSFSYSDEFILQKFLDNPAVCVKKNGKYVSSFSPNLYRYGQLSYLADNLLEYTSELSKNFSFANSKKEVQIIVGIMDMSSGKPELHYLGNGENDIVSIENVPSDFNIELSVQNNNVIEKITYNEILSSGFKQIIKLGNGKCYVVNENFSSYNNEDVKFTPENTPNDLEFYGLNKDEYNWTDYACFKGHYIIDDNNLFDISGSGVWYYKKANIFEVVLFGEIKCTDAELVKVLADDYKHRLIQALEKISDDEICDKYIEEVNKYLSKRKGEL